MNCVRRVSHLHDARGITNLYTVQVHSVMEHARLTWSSCPPSYLGFLDKVQSRVQQLISLKTSPHQQLVLLQHLQHRRNVLGLCTTYKIHRQGSPHLAHSDSHGRHFILTPSGTPTSGISNSSSPASVPWCYATLDTPQF